MGCLSLKKVPSWTGVRTKKVIGRCDEEGGETGGKCHLLKLYERHTLKEENRMEVKEKGASFLNSFPHHFSSLHGDNYKVLIISIVFSLNSELSNYSITKKFLEAALCSSKSIDWTDEGPNCR